MQWLDRLAERYLLRRGLRMIPRNFCGMILGGPSTSALRTFQSPEGDVYEVRLPPPGFAEFAVNNHAILDFGQFADLQLGGNVRADRVDDVPGGSTVFSFTSKSS